MTRTELRRVAKRRARAARTVVDAAKRADQHLTFLSHGPMPCEDDGGTSCPWCHRGCHPARLGTWGLCEDCAGLEAATHTPTTHRRLVARLGVRARRGDIDPETYASALRAHRGHD